MSMSIENDVASRVGAHRQPSLVDQVTEGLEAQIRRGVHKPGEMLPSVQSLAQAWGVSRTVLREALARLAAADLVTSRQGLGVFVASVLPAEPLALTTGANASDLTYIIELRLALETEAAGLAAVRHSAADIAAMKRQVALMKRCIADGDLASSIVADLDFHRSIGAATGNPHFEQLFSFLNQFLERNIAVARQNSASRKGRGMEAQREHEAILEAIESRRPLVAREAARRHVLKTAERLSLKIDLEAVGRRHRRSGA